MRKRLKGDSSRCLPRGLQLIAHGSLLRAGNDAFWAELDEHLCVCVSNNITLRKNWVVNIE